MTQPGAAPVPSSVQQPVLVIMGVSGSGKSTVAGILAGQLGWDLEEGDDLHPAENVAKMASGVPLTDEDRWPWLDTIASWIIEHTMAGIPGIITCSALKRIYRDRLRQKNVVFVHLSGSKEQIARRLTARMDHYMPATLLDSQIATLEPPGPDENTIVVDVGRTPAEEAAEVVRRLGLFPASGSTALGHPHPGSSSTEIAGRVNADSPDRRGNPDALPGS
ncbi:gluconokinase [Arthrobacter sp. NPDC057013]|uniref:gluconokinase n=1 Tax=Arthrobacter sp. NPDC057013 TaxID=3345999 RepID=UPI00363BB762